MSITTAVIDTESTVHGQGNENLRIVAGGRLTQHGQTNGDIVVEREGVLDQHGQVNGSIRARAGAVVRLWGQVNGEVYAEDGSDFCIAEGVMLLSRGSHRYVAADGTFQALPKDAPFTSFIGSTMWRLGSDGQLSPA